MSSSSTTTTTTPGSPHDNCKGKHTTSSWPHLPEELVRHIATFYLWDRATTTYTPSTWDVRELWHHRMVFTVIRDAFDLERNLMAVCPEWDLALETHLFWQQAVTLVDPTDFLGQFAIITPHPDLAKVSPVPLRPYRITPYRHFRHIIGLSCLVCRVNFPTTTRGLACAKRTAGTYILGYVPICRDHDHRRLAFCGLCLRESPTHEMASANVYASNDLQVGVSKNDDKEMWPGVDATCRNCRHEWLWKKASLNSRDQEAIGGIDLSSDDWETRQTVEGFVEMAEGTINAVINLAREKYWLRKFTRLDDMMQQALAAAKFNGYPSRSSSVRDDAEYGNWEESLAEEDDEEEEDTELMQLEERGVKDLALGDWARTRILDGYWISPADIWFRNIVPGKAFDMPAEHPCPWTVEDRTNLPHPSPTVVKAEVPPSWDLCHQACFAFGQQLRLILLPAMKNIVRRIAMECAMADGKDEPTLKASRLSLEEVARVLREEEGVWFDGYDWVERRRNDEEARRSSEGEAISREDDARSTRSTTSSTNSSGSESVGSTTTSPVLSTTTLQTTPSPPPPGDVGEKKNVSSPEHLNHQTTSTVTDWDTLNVAEKVIIPVDPVLNPPRILRSIPHIPRSLAHLPQYSIEAFKNIWREACAPLYHCRCRICERAVAAANALNDQGQPLSPITAQKQQLQEQQPLRRRPDESPLQIQLQEVSDLEYSGEEEEEEYEFDEDEEVDVVDVEEDGGGRDVEEEEEEESENMTVRIPPSILATRRKRSVDEIEDREERGRSGSPTKRQKKEKMKGGNRTAATTIAAPRIQGKRSSEELEE
ncbi:hypothetical protein AGABI2DRAFT_220564, partial [Agaricus bisporus var. bisporus H97]|uniref:hypothetical protein n=1 Tax=Agaricus bisporus var. bisporus (strain H97 / ATCC MYA-4626 / FGSC 10389) TaxID=936046 RepID=UPI00029F61CA